MTRVVIDTNILVKAFCDDEVDHRCVASSIASKKLRLALDYGEGICKEYRNNVGKKQGFEKWWVRLHQIRAFDYFSGQLKNQYRSKLKSLGCHEDSDHIFLAVAYNADRILITEDSDFGKGPKGNHPPHSQALHYIQTTMGIIVMDAKQACEKFA